VCIKKSRKRGNFILFNERFIEILKNYPDVITNRKKFVGLLRDFFPLPKDTKRTRLLTNLHELGIAEEIEKADTLNDRFAYRYIKRLVEEYGVDDQNAAWGVRAWCVCYGEGVLGLPCQVNAVEDSFAYAVDESDDDFATMETETVSPPKMGAIGATGAESDGVYRKKQGKILIPCGDTDSGYFICGIIETPRCNHPYANIYALIYNYIMRSTQMNRRENTDKPQVTPKFFREMKTTFQLDYSKVFRLKTIILQLIKNNYITDSQVNFRYDGDIAELRCALVIINNYAALFCRLIGLPPCPPLRISDKSKAITISFLQKIGVYLESNTTPNNKRELWLGQRINYKLNQTHLRDLEYILSEISTFHSFREGQFESLKKMLAADEHSVCTMPTGRGKSLLFYLASLLQPLPLLVIMPTDSLIDDHIQNLNLVHNFDNTAQLNSPTDEICNSLIFLTPQTFINGAGMNKIDNVSYVLLDETHCLANWQYEMSYEKIGDLAAGGITRDSVTSIALLNGNTHRYSYGFDLLLFLAKLRFESAFDNVQLDRIMEKTAKKDFWALCNAVAKVYSHCSDTVRFEIHKGLQTRFEKHEMPYKNLFDIIYLSAKKDIIYYGVMATKLNPQFSE
jgi:hypothetical protein